MLLIKGNTFSCVRVSDCDLSQPTAIDHSTPRTRHLLGVLLLVVLWLTQVRYPPLSYPSIGLFVLTIVAAMAVLLPVKAFTAARMSVTPLMRHPALLAGFCVIAWVVGRWAMAGFPVTGAAEVGTLLWAAVYLCVAFLLTSARDDSAENTGSIRPSISLIFLFVLSAVGLICGLHAVWQYHFSYMDSYQTLLKSIGNRAPDRTEAALLHHLHLRRVASIWGDPNTLATFSAMAICASLELLARRGRGAYLSRAVAIVSVFACAAAIYYSGSRGGALDAFGVFVVFGGFLLWSARFRTKGSSAAAALLIALVVWTAFPARTGAQVEQTSLTSPEPEPSGWVWRSDTIRERLYYLQVGEKMIRMAPLVGLGPGSVELYFGRLKPAEARETKYLHNWIVQTWAETGLVGLCLTLWFLLAIGWRIMKNRLWRQPNDRALVFISLVLIFDGLLQISWNQREIFTTFGLICGVLMARTGSLEPIRPTSSWLNSMRLTGFIGLVGVFALLESRYLLSATSKQIAADAMYAGEKAEAKEQWERATQWMPRDAEPYAARASLALESSQLSSARMLIEKALALEPESAALHAQAANIYSHLRQGDLAYTHLTKALGLYPAKPEYNYLYAKELQSQDRLPEALHFAEKAAAFNYLPELADRYTSLVTQLNNVLKEATSD